MKTPLILAVAGFAVFGVAGCSTPSEEAAPSPVGEAKVAPPAILEAGTLRICAPNDGTPPSVYHDAGGELIGSEVDLGKALAAQMGLKAQFQESSFATVIPTLQAKQCDVIMAQLYIKPEREAVVDFVPYVYSGTGIAVAENDPAAITGLDDSMCGMKVAVGLATTAEAQAQEQSGKCVAAGKLPVELVISPQTDISIQQLQNGQVDAFMETAESLGYYETKTGAQIKTVGPPFGTIKIGAATLKGNTELHDAIAAALAELEADGTYGKILEEWGMSDLNISN